MFGLRKYTESEEKYSIASKNLQLALKSSVDMRKNLRKLNQKGLLSQSCHMMVTMEFTLLIGRSGRETRPYPHGGPRGRMWISIRLTYRWNVELIISRLSGMWNLVICHFFQSWQEASQYCMTWICAFFRVRSAEMQSMLRLDRLDDPVEKADKSGKAY